MLRHRLSKFGKASLLALCALLVGGMLNSCQDQFDEYSYDDGDQPAWLGESVYSFLRENNSGHTYNCYADIVDRLGQTEIFNKTGSKTIFVADDEAFERFFANNRWGVKSVDEMTEAQLKILLKGSMLDDAMLLDMLSASNADVLSEGTCMRRVSSLASVDTIPLVLKKDMPKFNKYWDALYAQGNLDDDSLRIAMDGSNPMLVYFLPDFLKKNAIKEDDISFLFYKNGEQAKTYETGDAFIFDKKILPSDVETGDFSDDEMTITCKNGYVYRLDDVLIPPLNMAAEIRAREDLSVFSRLLDRYCLPVYDKTLSDEFTSVTGKTDSVFRLRYYTQDGGGGLDIRDKVLKDTLNMPLAKTDVLLFDPGNNAYAALGKSAQADMGAILVPNNDAMLEFFTNGQGALILNFHAPEVTVTDLESLNEALDLVPDNNVATFLNHHMQTSFVQKVHSRFDKIVDEVNDQVQGVAEAVIESIVANNGVIYVTNKAFSPADYDAVSTPTVIKGNTKGNMNIMRQVIEQLGYKSFLLAKNAEYTLFMPDDKAFLYYDPVKTVQAREFNNKATLYELHYDTERSSKKDTYYLYAKEYKYNLGEDGGYVLTSDKVDYSTNIDIGKVAKDFGDASLPTFSNKNFNNIMYNRMSDLIENLIVLGDVTSGNKYYLTKGGNAVKVDATDLSNIKIQGGEQIEIGKYVAVKEAFFNYINGHSLVTIPEEEGEAWDTKQTGIPTPATKTLYRQIKEMAKTSDAPFYQFLKLAWPDEYYTTASSSVTKHRVEDVLKLVFPDIASNTTALTDSTRVYSLFHNNRPKVYMGVAAFGGYNYTVYIPSNDAVVDVINRGLPTWDDIYSCAAGENGGTLAQARAAMKLLNGFFRYHIQDNSIFVDNIPYKGTYETAYINDNGVYETLDVDMQGGALYVTDKSGNKVKVLADDLSAENKTWNVLCRDVEYNGISGELVAIVASSSSVAHHIDNVLAFDGFYGYDGLVQRFAPDGEKVVKVGDNIVAQKKGKVQGADGQEKILAGYLMEEKAEAEQTKLSHEKYVLDGNGEKILITEDGYKVVETESGYEFQLLPTE